MTESTAPTANNYKDTLNLPKTNFDMKANLTQREPAMLKQWQDQNLYQQIRTARKGSAGGGKGKWVLHDGPPYANGDIHMGHLINKTLKDIVVKFRTMQGFDSPYVPGWDCHGLPIESAIQKELGPKFRELSKEEVRKKCADYAMKYVKLQGDSFQRLGILGEFNNPYLTLNPHYESGILEVLAELVKRDLVYRQKKPVHWCTNDRTALAEAELEYANRKDNSIYVNFKLANVTTLKSNSEATEYFLKQLRPFANNAYLMIWTTTPWTLPANRAVAVHPDHEYVVHWYREKSDTTGGPYTKCVIVASQALDRIRNLGYFADGETHGPVTGRELVEMGLKYFHPLGAPEATETTQLEIDALKGAHESLKPLVQPIVLADYVTLEDGTGLVHTAPGHGKEDYQTGLKYNLEIYNPVLPDGRYDDSVPEFLRGKSIWDANDLVLQKLTEQGTLFHAQKFDHEYPHCWRCKKPVIFRATEQWFIAVDKPFKNDHDPAGLTPKTIRERALMAAGLNPQQPIFTETQAKSIEEQRLFEQEENQKLREAEERGEWKIKPADPKVLAKLDAKYGPELQLFRRLSGVRFIPSWGENRLNGMLLTRPDWCISRQRSWGVPIPAFFDNKNRCLLTEASVRRTAAYFAQHGADSWYTDSAERILGLDPNNQAQGLQSLGFPADVDVATLERGLDILDVWFESGASHHAVLERTHPELGYPANMYLEGSDQHRGWFQSSLLEAAGYKSEPPFKQVLTHGFVVDEKGRKMSKSEGNDIKVDAALKQYGADVLRLWVSSVDYQNDIPCGPNLLAKTADAYRKIRNTIRYLLGNLYDFNPTTDSVAPAPHSIDAWMQNKLDTWAKDVYTAYDTYEFHNVFKLVYEFCNVEISAVYAKAIKDRLYCELPTSPKRRASQTVCYNALIKLIELTAPVLAFTAEESWSAVRSLPGCADLEPSVHLHAINSEFRIQNSEFADKHWALLMPLIEKGNKQLDELKRAIGLGNPLDAEAVIILPKVEDEVSRLVTEYAPEIEDALGVGYHRIEHGEVWDIKINDTRQLYPSCARSWKRRPDVGSDPAYPDLSARDAAVVKALQGNP